MSSGNCWVSFKDAKGNVHNCDQHNGHNGDHHCDKCGASPKKRVSSKLTKREANDIIEAALK